MTRRRLGLAGAAAALALACAPRPWDPAPLAARHPGVDLGALAGATPYALPASGALVLFLCRWSTERPIPVSLPGDAKAAERELLERVLSAWEGAGLGVRFERVAAGEAAIRIRFLPPADEREATPRAAYTTADCGVAPSALDGPASPVLPARLMSASVALRRSERNAVGREVRHTPEELAGSALHEMGHALGFQGHAKRGGSVVNRSVDAARRAGRRLLAGEALRDPALGALYALPSGTVLRRTPAPAAQTSPVDRLARLARAGEWLGPFVRVGDRVGRVHWRDASGATYALLLPDVQALLRDPAALRVVPVGAAAARLAPGEG